MWLHDDPRLVGDVKSAAEWTAGALEELGVAGSGFMTGSTTGSSTGFFLSDPLGADEAERDDSENATESMLAGLLP